SNYITALKRLVGHRVALGSYALELLLIAFLQTENPPLLPKLQSSGSGGVTEGGHSGDQTIEKSNHDTVKEVIIQGIDCSFDRDWKRYEGMGSGNVKSAAELMMECCRFFGYVFDYEHKEVNTRVGTFRWRSAPMLSSSDGSSDGSNVNRTSLSGPTDILSLSSLSIFPLQISIPKSKGPGGGGRDSEAGGFYVMDPFLVGYNVAWRCDAELVRSIKECFQDVYEALNDGEINIAFSD
ncbi:hypothetical protein BGW38_007586, partial [Lunasporangiospora selenospora]